MSEDRGISMERVETGQPELDAILRGGFPSHSINIIMGPPGTGKTILVQQTLFHNAGGDRPVVYLSTLSEPLAKVISHLQRFSFYDDSLMMESIIYEDMGEELLEDGTERLIDRVRRIIQEHGPSILVIDSFKAIHDLSSDPYQMRRLAAGLGGLLAAYDMTTFLVGEYTQEAVDRYPEFAVADGIVHLERDPTDKREDRRLRVLKLRGSGFREGSHAFTLSEHGLEVYPRLVTPIEPESYEPSDHRLDSGTEGLNELLGGGVWRGSSTIVLGSAGTGKTTIGLRFALAGAEVGEPSLYVNFQENPSQLDRTMHSLGIDPDRYRADTLFFQYESPVEMQIDAVVVKLFRTIEEKGIRRVVIDALGDLALAAVSRERFHDYLYSVVQHFAARGVTSFMTLEGTIEHGLGPDRNRGRFSTLSDAIIALDLDAETDPPVRTLRVVKARGTAHALEARPIRIDSGGVRVLPPEAT